MEVLAKKYGRTRASVYRIVNEVRALRILELPLEFMPTPEFLKATAEQKIMGEMPQPEEAIRKTRPPSGLPPYLASLYEVPLMTREQEVHQFRQI